MVDIYFKGYVPTKNKQSQMKFKDAEPKDLLTLEEAQKLQGFAGVLASDIILVDIDDYEQSELLYKMVQDLKLKCQVYKTTRGKHFLFRNNDIKKNDIGLTLAVGLTADIKIGKNSYSVLKLNGMEREILLDCEEPQTIPSWLRPLKKGVNVSFLHMSDGDGRNQALFNYILTLQAYNFSERNVKECIRLINEYMLSERLDDNEINTILRPEAFSKEIFFVEGKFQHDLFANILKNRCYILKIYNQLHIYQDGVYVSGKRLLEREMLKMYPSIKKAQRAEVYEYLDISATDEAQDTDVNLIAFRNGIYNLLTDELQPFSSDHIVTNLVPWDYNPNAYCSITDEVLNNISVGDKQIRSLLEEMAGYCFYRRNELGKAFILTGDRCNGKSTYLDMIKIMIGEKNIAALDLVDLNHNFRAAEVVGKLANIGDDIGDEYISNTGNFKKIVTGSAITVERKNQDPLTYVSQVKLLFSANNIPRLGKGKDAAAIKRRLIIIPFDAKFDPKDPNFKPYIKYELIKQPAMEYLIQLGIAGLKRILLNRGFTESGKVEKSIAEYEETNNPVLGFFKEVEVEGINIANEPTSHVYKMYCEYCIRSGLQALSNIEFSRQVVKHFNFEVVVKKIQGKSVRCFVAVTHKDTD